MTPSEDKMGLTNITTSFGLLDPETQEALLAAADGWIGIKPAPSEDKMDLTKITTSFGLLDPETQKALMAHGGPYEVYCYDGKWEDFTPPAAWFTWGNTTYRVKPAPSEDTVDPIKIKAWAVVDLGGEEYDKLFWEKSEAIEWAEQWGGTVVKLKGKVK